MTDLKKMKIKLRSDDFDVVISKVSETEEIINEIGDEFQSINEVFLLINQATKNITKSQKLLKRPFQYLKRHHRNALPLLEAVTIMKLFCTDITYKEGWSTYTAYSKLPETHADRIVDLMKKSLKFSSGTVEGKVIIPFTNFFDKTNNTASDRYFWGVAKVLAGISYLFNRKFTDDIREVMSFPVMSAYEALDKFTPFLQLLREEVNEIINKNKVKKGKAETKIAETDNYTISLVMEINPIVKKEEITDYALKDAYFHFPLFANTREYSDKNEENDEKMRAFAVLCRSVFSYFKISFKMNYRNRLQTLVKKLPLKRGVTEDLIYKVIPVGGAVISSLTKDGYSYNPRYEEGLYISSNFGVPVYLPPPELRDFRDKIYRVLLGLRDYVHEDDFASRINDALAQKFFLLDDEKGALVYFSNKGNQVSIPVNFYEVNDNTLALFARRFHLNAFVSDSDRVQYGSRLSKISICGNSEIFYNRFLEELTSANLRDEVNLIQPLLKVYEDLYQKDINLYKKFRDLMVKVSSSIYHVVKDRGFEILNSLKEEQNVSNISVGGSNIGESRLVFDILKEIGNVNLLYRITSNIDRLIENKKKKEEIMKTSQEDITEDDVIPLPLLDKSTMMLPHQIHALKIMDAVDEHEGILDVSTGGGKTFIILCDILNLMKKKKIKRPLIVVPTQLVGQWVTEIIKFTGGKVNPIAVTTETVNSWGIEEIEKIIKEAPPNSIFITSYDFIRKEEFSYATGVGRYVNAEFILDTVEPDYIACDEVHYVKNLKASRTKATIFLSSKCKYKRIGTGTLDVNSPLDLAGELSILNPAILGDEDCIKSHFASDYNSTTVYSWFPNAMDLMREIISNETTHIKKRVYDWAFLLPDLEFDYHIVELNDELRRIYNDIAREIISEIQDDANLATKLEEILNDLESDDISLPPEILHRVTKIEQFLTNPGKLALGRVYEGEPPKLEAIDNLIEKTINQKSKAIVAFHYKEGGAQFIYNKSRFKDYGVYYDASKQNAIQRFMRDDNVKVMFAVCQSITEGKNLTMASRIILGDIEWSHGKLLQLVARLFRPYLVYDKKQKRYVNLNEGRTVYIDYIIVKDTIDALKISLQIYKKALSARLDGEDIRLPERPIITSENFVNPPVNLYSYIEVDADYWDTIKEKIEERKQKSKLKSLVPAKIDKPPFKGLKRIDVPWVVGMPTPPISSEAVIFLSEYIRENITPNYASLKDENIEESIKGLQVITDKGVGKIVSVFKESVRVRLDDGSYVTYKPEKILVSKNQKIDVIEVIKNIKPDESEEEIKEKKEKPKKEKKEEKPKSKEERPKETKKKEEKEEKPLKKDSAIAAFPAYYNDIPANVVGADDEDAKELVKYGYKLIPSYWALRIKGRNHGYRILEMLEKEFKIPPTNKKMIEHALNMMKRNYVELDKDNLKQIKVFYKMIHKKAKPGVLKLYPLIEGGDKFVLFFVVNKGNHPNVNLSKYGFRLEEGFYIKFFKNMKEVKKELVNLSKKLRIVNADEVADWMTKLFHVPSKPEDFMAVKPSRRGRK